MRSRRLRVLHSYAHRTAAACLLAGIPGAASAQGALAGVVVDPTGGALAHVTVEASSSALIEKMRSTVTDEHGRYRIENVRPGTYRLSFTLPMWQPRALEHVEVTGSGTVIVNVTLALERLTDDVRVVSRVPAIDLQGTTREAVLRGELVTQLPAARSYNALLPLVPGVLTNVNDVITETATASFPIHGGRTGEGRLLLDGLNIGSPPSGNSATAYAFDPGAALEVTFTTAAALGERETGGLVMNLVPRIGGNTTRASVFAAASSAGLQSSNLTPTLTAQGITATPFDRLYDFSAWVGGPIVKQHLWYFAHGRIGGSRKNSPNVFYNLNAGDPSRWLYAPDTSRRAYSDRTFENASARLTWQVARRHRLTAFWDAQALCRACTGATPGLSEPQRVAPEAVGVLGRRLDVAQVAWSSPVTSQLLLEAGFGGTHFGVGNFEREPNPTRDLIRVVEQCAAGCAGNGNIPGLAYRSQDFSEAHTGSYLWNATASHVTGTHSVKVGYQHTYMTDDRTWMTNTAGLAYRVNNGVPNQLTQSIAPWVNDTRVAWSAIFAQGQWTRGRMTLQGALRYDRAWSWFPRQQLGPSRFLPDPIVVPETRGVDSYQDVTPRGGLAWDVFGTGRTAVKFTAGKYLEGAGAYSTYATANPTLRMPRTTAAFGTGGVTRAWTDGNRNFVPDCNLLDPAAQDLRGSGGDLCGVMSNTQFGRNILTSEFDPRILAGWSVRPSDWLVNASIQQQLGTRSSVAVTYTRRSFDGFTVVDNRQLGSSDMTPFSVTAPLDPRLPGGGGYVVSGLFDVVPEKAGLVDNHVTDSRQFGSWSQRFEGLDIILNVRAARGLTLMGGASTGRTLADNCEVRNRLPELATTTTGTSAFGAGLAASAVSPVSPYCRVSYGILTQVRGLATYTVPRIEVLLSTTFQSKPGAMLAATYAVPNADVVPSLGRNLSGNAANVTVNLVTPGSLYGDRINQLDVRLAKPLSIGRWRTTIGIDVFNVLNSSAVLTYNHTYVPGGPWLQPLTVMSPRLVRLTAEVDF
jgi:hypothetical protein